jgi:hypothetical protein
MTSAISEVHAMNRAIAERATALVTALVVLAGVLPAAGGDAERWSAMDFPGPDPGRAAATIEGDNVRLKNDALAVEWKVPDQGAHLVAVRDKRSGAAISTRAELFVLTLADGRVLSASELKRGGPPRSEKLAANPQATCRAHRSAGQQVSVTLASADGSLEVLWQAVLRDGSNYVRQFVTLRALKDEIPIRNIRLIDLPALGARVAGTVAGSPVVEGSIFFAYEHPNAKNEVVDQHPPGEPNPPMKQIRCSLDRQQPLQPGGGPSGSLVQSAVIGVAPEGQLRRAYLYYIERERPRPYTPFLHYNSWYDIAWGDRKMDEKQCLGVIGAFGRELTEKRGVALDSFVFDDGWDDNRTLWGFHPGFPRGFAPLDAAAKRYKSHVGVWLSPWGGYGQAKAERLKYGQTQGFETNPNGFSLAGPKYYARFRQVCAEMIEKYGVNYFKFDGVGAGNDQAGADPRYLADIDGLLRLCQDLRRLRPDVYLSITTGTWPSPYWLFWGDSTWRNGADCGFHGTGSMRQRWITYRDTYTYRMVVRRGPLYPLNSLMVQGICCAQLGTATKMGNDLKDVVDEIRMLFASGTQLQELYVTPQMMTPPMWDALAEATRWSRENADVLVDVHWLGGDPGAGEPYGYASWSPRKGILALRNPSDKPVEMTVDLKAAFELPDGAPRRYALASPWKDNGQAAKLTLDAGSAHTFKLAPFDALVLEATAIRP